uniref:HTH_48 domain-containing protein n=1 Tax=Trichuris muris TaxID=70415 RepID=A0A5S6R3X4_TRIMR
MSFRRFREIFLYEWKNGTSVAVTAQNINIAFGALSVSERTVRRWYRKFEKGDESLESEPRGRPETRVDTDTLKELVEADPSRTVRELAVDLNVSHTTVHKHVRQMGKVKKLEKWVPHELTDQQKLMRQQMASSLLIRNEMEPFLDRIVTCDEKWILYDNRKRSGQWLDADACPNQVARPNIQQKKIMVTVWWSMGGIIHYSFMNPGETMTGEKYSSELKIMHEKLKEIRPRLLNRKGPILLHDNARPHVSKIVARKLAELRYETLSHSPYSPDLSPTDYHLFKHLELFLRGKTFPNEEAAKQTFRDFINSRSPGSYISGIQKLVSRWRRCADCDGAYFD